MTAWWHGSAAALPVGTILVPGESGYVARADADLEAMLEAFRPAHCIPRAEAVFLVADPADIDAAGGEECFVYQVELHDGMLPERHDLAWFTAMQGYVGDGDTASAQDCAAAYWSGDIFYDRSASLFEYLARAAEVKACLDLDAVPERQP